MSGMFSKMKKSPLRLIALGFLAVILIGTVLLLLPVSRQEGAELSPLNALFTSTSAVCVTGLITVDTAGTFSVFGRSVIAVLISIGGLGVASIGVSFFLLAGRRVNLNQRRMLKEQLNLSSFSGIIKVLRTVLLITLVTELAGAIVSWIAFARVMPIWKALGTGVFHSISAFNNAGFDILGNMQSLEGFRTDPLLLISTAVLIILGSTGFLVMTDLWHKKSFKKLALNSKIALTASAVLLVGGALLFRLTGSESWLDSFFNSITARTAGFASVNMSSLSGAGCMVMMLLMFIGASPGSTGGGIKTTTGFVIAASAFSASANRPCSVFRRRIDPGLGVKAFVLTALAALTVLLSSFLLCVFEPDKSFTDLLFESVSAFATVGLSRGVTPELSAAGRIVVICTMFIGRLGPVTIAGLWVYKPKSDVSYASENVTIG